MVEFPYLNIFFLFEILFEYIKYYFAVFIDFLNSPLSTWIFLVWILLGLVLMMLCFYLITKLFALRKEEILELRQALKNINTEVGERDLQWASILEKLNSDNSSDWKVAIIEADNMLEELVTRMGYEGVNLGEKLKSVEPSDFLTLQDAWEAHKVRNAIAHEGGYELSKREARRVINLFERVFREFHFI